ncbi:MAG: CPBP family intramembrane metalloprotease [Aridibacter famidurans]|nr:CPBP family intramembrane metalloprotease [Aridibacter famidurans]
MNQVLFDSFGRLRSGWRFAIFMAVFIVAVSLTIPAFRAVAILLLDEPQQSLPILTFLSSVISLAIVLLISWGCGKLLEHLPFKALGASFTKYWLKDLILGLLLGAAAVVIAVGIAAMFGGLSFGFNDEAGGTILMAALVSLGIFTAGAAFEEAFARGYIFQTFVRSNLAWLALLLTSAIFASGHIGNPSSGTFSFVNTFLAGIWLGAAYLKTRTLWLAFGLHVAWNFVLGTVFGIEVSGLTQLSEYPILREMDTGPEWITGGKYGLEGGIACTVALVVSTAALWFAPFLKASDEMAELSSPPDAGGSTAEGAEQN